jgi:hypothetical protein
MGTCIFDELASLNRINHQEECNLKEKVKSERNE